MKNDEAESEEQPSDEDLAAAEKELEEETKNSDLLRKLSKEDRQEIILQIAKRQSQFRQLDEGPWLRALKEAHACEGVRDWVGAEAGYQKAISVSADEPGLQFKAYELLSCFYTLFGRDEEALNAAHTASELSRTCDMEMAVPPVLTREAYLQLSAGSQQAAHELIEEAMQILNCLEQRPILNLLKSRVLLARCNYYLERGELTEVDSDLKSVEELLEVARDYPELAGFQWAIGLYWSIRARLLNKSGDKMGALAALSEVVRRSRSIAEASHIEGLDKYNSLAQNLALLGQAQKEAGDPQAAESFKESASIRQSIGLAPLRV